MLVSTNNARSLNGIWGHCGVVPSAAWSNRLIGKIQEPSRDHTAGTAMGLIRAWSIPGRTRHLTKLDSGGMSIPIFVTHDDVTCDSDAMTVLCLTRVSQKSRSRLCLLGIFPRHCLSKPGNAILSLHQFTIRRRSDAPHIHAGTS